MLPVLDYVGVFVFAVTGAIVAGRKGMDVFGFIVLALMPAVGGGTIRDLVLDVPVFWTQDTAYLWITLIAAFTTFVGFGVLQRVHRIMSWLDAAGLAVFSVLGAAKTLALTGEPTLAVVMGVVTAVAGGIVRDVIANDVPLVLRSEVYATAAFCGALTYVLLAEWAVQAVWIGVAAAFVVRALGIAFGLSLPRRGGS